MYKQLTTGKMENQPKSSHLTAHQDIKRIDIISSPFLGIQQQWKGAQARLHTCFSHFIDAIHQTLQHPGLNRSSIDEIVLRLQFPLFKQGSDAKPGYSRRVEDWPTRLKKTWETVGVHVGQALQAGKDKFAESFRPSANENPVWACSSLSQNAFNSHFEPRHLFDLAMSTEQVAKRLDGIPVYTLSNGSNEFALVSDANNERFVALFCFRPQDAEALLSEVQNREPALVCRAKVVAVSLNKVYELRTEGIAFRFLPDPNQVINALEASKKVGVSGQCFPGVPVFQSNNLILRSKDKRFSPIFFRKEDLEGCLKRAYQQQKKLNPSTQFDTDIQVGSFEDIIKRMENNEESSEWGNVVFIPPGFDALNHVGKQLLSRSSRSCWSFSTTGAIEGINAISTGNLISLSEQELVDCDSTNYGCDGGYMDYAFAWVIQNGGIDTEQNYSYTGIQSACIKKKEESKVVTIDGYADVFPEESALLRAVNKQPVSVGIDGSAMDFQLYAGGIYDGDCSGDPDDIDHAVLIVGYSSENDKEYWIVKNSWGSDWGLKGYIYIQRNTKLAYGVCAINAMASYPTKEISLVQVE